MVNYWKLNHNINKGYGEFYYSIKWLSIIIRQKLLLKILWCDINVIKLSNGTCSNVIIIIINFFLKLTFQNVGSYPKFE